jgi:hypothetical protein
MDLTTSYLGLRLRNRLVAFASPLSYTPDSIRRLADASVGAIVMFSLFEERLRERAVQITRLVDGPTESFLEAFEPRQGRAQAQYRPGKRTGPQGRPQRPAQRRHRPCLRR